MVLGHNWRSRFGQLCSRNPCICYMYHRQIIGGMNYGLVGCHNSMPYFDGLDSELSVLYVLSL